MSENRDREENKSLRDFFLARSGQQVQWRFSEPLSASSDARPVAASPKVDRRTR